MIIRKKTWAYALSLAAVGGLFAAVPFNMGGCASGSGGGLADLTKNIPLPNAGGLDTHKLIEGGQQFADASSLSAQQETAIGQSVSLAIANKYGIVNNDSLNLYVLFVGEALNRRTPTAGRWVFAVLDTDQVNAYSAPGGFVFVTRGALAQMQDESELAGVLAHEIGHVNLHHGLKAVQQAGQLQGLFTAAQAQQNVGQATQQFGQASDFLVKFVTENGFEAPQEFEADSAAVKYAADAGYDPNGLVRFLTRVRAQQKQGFKLMSTHPDIDDRIRRLTDQISAAGTGGRGQTLRERFQKMTHGTGPG